MAEQGEQEQEVRREERIVRLMATDLDGDQPIVHALNSIKGIGFSFARALCQVTETDPERKAGDLSEEEMDALEEAIRNPNEFDIPVHMFNMRKDPETGDDLHLTGSEWEVSVRQRIKDLIDYGTYRGWRHKHGQPVRGQNTQSSFRGKGTVGVAIEEKREEMEAAGEAEEE